MYATPVDSAGTLVPITKYLLDPAEYYKKRSEIKNWAIIYPEYNHLEKK